MRDEWSLGAWCGEDLGSFVGEGMLWEGRVALMGRGVRVRTVGIS